MNTILVFLFFCTISVSARGSGHSSHGGGGRGRSHRAHGHVTSSHTHFAYHPPSHITYTCRGCSSASYPVYRHPPPTYVYAYKESNNRFGDVLTGLALYNLGRSSVGDHYKHSHYTSRPDEKCSMQVIEKSHFEETEIPCFIISSFLDNSGESSGGAHMVDITSSQNNVKPLLRKEGPPLEVTNDQQCVLWHNLTTYKERNVVPCALLKEYSSTVQSSGVPVYIWLPMLLGCVMAIYTCCYFCNRRKKENITEEYPLQETRPAPAGYCTNY